MRILQVHKFFYPHAGSETAMFHTRELLRSRGHEIIDFAMHDERNEPSKYASSFAPYRNYTDGDRPKHRRAVDAAMSVYSPIAGRRIRALAERTRPDVAHFHIVYHQLTMAVVRAVSRLGIPCVFTSHDYKIACPAYIAFRDDQPCEACSTGRVQNAIVHRCLKRSLPASLLAAAEAKVNGVAGLYDEIDVHITPSPFAGGVVARTGVPAERIHVIPNFLPDDEVGSPVTTLDPAPRFLYAGRLESEKGVLDVLEAFAGSGGELGTLVIAAAGGSLESTVREAAERDPAIEFRGRLTRDEVRDELKRSRALLMPSRWNENNPMSLLEARSVGIPVIATTRGGLPDMVTDDVDGLLVGPASIPELRAAVARLAADVGLAGRFGRNGNQRLLRENTEDVHYAALTAAYEHAAAVRRQRRR